MLIAINRTNVINTDVKIKDLIKLVSRYNQVTYTDTSPFSVTNSIDNTYSQVYSNLKNEAIDNKLIPYRADNLSTFYKSYGEGRLSLELFSYILSLYHLEYHAKEILKKMSIGKHKFDFITVDLFPKEDSIKPMLDKLELPPSHFENLFELLDRDLLSIVTFKDNYSNYPDTLSLLKDKFFYQLRVRYEFIRNTPSAYRYSVLYNLLRGCNTNISTLGNLPMNRSALDTFLIHLDKLGRKQAFSKSKIGISIF